MTTPADLHRAGVERMAGDYLLSHTREGAVPSAPEGLTSVFGMGTGMAPPTWSPTKSWIRKRVMVVDVEDDSKREEGQAVRAISTGPRTHCCVYTPRLSTRWSFWALKGEFIWRWASHLDAFSGYPFRSWLSGYAAGATTGTPEERPSRSSRTKDSASQLSCAHSR